MPHVSAAALGRTLLLVLAVLAASPARAQWAYGFGGPGSDAANAVALDADGGAFTAGTFTGTVDFDPGSGTHPLTSAGGQDIFLAHYLADGALDWAVRLGGPNWETALGLAVDAEGNVYLTGSFEGTADFDPGAGTIAFTAQDRDAFVARYPMGAGGCAQSLTATLDDATPAPGQTVTFTVTVSNGAASPAPLDLWLDVTGPASRTLRLASGTLPAGATVTRNVRVRVPPGAPAGAYAADLRIGTFPGDVCDTEAFTLTVGGAPLAGGTDAAFTAEVEGDLFAAAAAAAVSVSPNPFRGQTAIRYAVAEAAEVRLAVYDVLGREVAVLVEGRAEAGAHSATFDGRGLAAGTYVYRLRVGSDVRTGRMTLAF